MPGSIVSALARLRHRTVSGGAVAGGLGVLVLAVEGYWRSTYALPSPLLALLPFTAAFLAWRLVERVVYGRPVSSFVEGAVGGGTVLSALFLLLQACKAHVFFAPVVAALALLGAIFGRLKSFVARRVPVWRLPVLLVFFGLAMSASFIVDRLPLTSKNPWMFPWIDTPLWLANAYGVARAFPVPDLLVNGGLLDYHYGASILPVVVRDTTGLPMHVAYVTVMVFYAWAIGPLLLRLLERILHPRWRTRVALTWIVPLFVVLWYSEFIYNFPTVVAHAIALFALGQVRRIRSWRSLLFLPVLFFILLATKEIDYLFTFVASGVIILQRFLSVRDWKLGAVMVLTGAITAPLFTRLVRIHQKSSFAFFRERFEDNGLSDFWDLNWSWCLTAVAAAIAGIYLWRRWRAGSFVILAGGAVWCVGTFIAVLLKPVFQPPMNAHFTQWALWDMLQFQQNGNHAIIIALGFVGLVYVLGATDRRHLVVFELVIAVLGIQYFHDHRWRSPLPKRPPNAADASDVATRLGAHWDADPVVDALHAIPVSGIVMADQFLMNGETPHWVAFFGHRFYLLRTGRWANAQPHFEDMKEKQERVYGTSSAAEAMEIMRAEGVTHIVVDKHRAAKWTSGVTPIFENGAYAVFAVI